MDFYRKNQQVIRYLIAGILTTVVSLAVYYFISGIVINPNSALELQIANVISWVTAVTFAYFVNRKYVFESEDRHVLKQALTFYVSRLTTLLMDMMLMFVLVICMGIDDRISKLVVQAAILVANYLLSRLVVF